MGEGCLGWKISGLWLGTQEQVETCKQYSGMYFCLFVFSIWDIPYLLIFTANQHFENAAYYLLHFQLFVHSPFELIG